MKNLSHYRYLAELFRYPSEAMKPFLGICREIVEKYDPRLLLKFDPFQSVISEQPLSFAQEYFVKTFDVQPLCSLDIGYILFGDDYKRCMFMVNIKKEQEKAENDCGSELPDHLTNILTLLPAVKDADFAEELTYSIMIPAIHEMISKFGDSSNIYKGLLEILAAIMEADYPVSAFERFDFKAARKTGAFDACRARMITNEFNGNNKSG